MADITRQEYYNWVASHQNSREYEMILHEDSITMQSEYAVGVIDFVFIMNYEIIQMQITDKKDNDTKFYMHFELLDKVRAFLLFEEMEEVFLSLKDKQKHKVLLCCTGGLTTSYFAAELNKTARLLKYDYEFDAVGYDDLYNKVFSDAYSFVLLAPQIRHRLNEVQHIVTHRTVLDIPTKVFASYDTGALFELLKQNENTAMETTPAEMPEARKARLKMETNILSICVVIWRDSVHICYGLYENGMLAYRSEVIKNRFDIFDLQDIIRMVSFDYKLDYIGISIPGIVTNGVIYLPDDPKGNRIIAESDIYNYNQLDLQGELEKAFHIPVVVTNSTQMSALGFYSTHPEYRTITYHSHQITGMFTESTVIDGRLVVGKNHIAGQISYLVKDLKGISEKKSTSSNPKDIEKIIVKLLIANIVNVGPDLICITSPLTPDVEKIRRKISRTIPERYLPDFIYVTPEDRTSYMMIGNYDRCLKKMEKKMRKKQ